MNEETYFEKAKALIYNDREKDYGHPFDNLTRIGQGWGTILGTEAIAPEKVALMMAWLKIARLIHGFKVDSVHDAMGYLGLIERVLLERERRQ